MFGYIKPFADELKVKEYALFKAYYCGLCRALKSRVKNCAVLNFDCAFLYILADSLKGEETAQPGVCRCAMGPFKRPAVYGAGAEYAACVNALMAHAKAADDAADKGVLHGAKELILRGAKNRAAQNLPDVARLSEEAAKQMRENEKSEEASPDAAADPYARLFGSITANIDPYQKDTLYELGYNLGRWVYLIDAWDDIAEDLKIGSYNVFVNKYSLKAAPAKDAAEDARLTFYYTLARAKDALDAVALKKNAPLLYNIVSLGLKNTTRTVFERSEDGSLPRAGRRAKRFGR